MKEILYLIFVITLFLSSCSRKSNLERLGTTHLHDQNSVSIIEQNGFDLTIEETGSIPFRGVVKIINNCGDIHVGDFHNNVQFSYTDPQGKEFSYDSKSSHGFYVGHYHKGDTITSRFHYNYTMLKHTLGSKPSDGVYIYNNKLQLGDCSYEYEMKFYFDQTMID